MSDDGARASDFVDRTESKLNSWHPEQINAKKVTVRRAVAMEHSEARTNLNRTELNVEVAGVRESPLTTTSSSKVVSNTVRTVYGRSRSGGSSTSSVEDSNNLSFEESDASSAFGSRTPTEVVDGGVWQRHRKTSDSHYISQTYHVDPVEATDSPSKSVTAIQNVTFKSSKKLSIGTPGKGGTAGVDREQELRFIDRREEVIVPNAPAVLGSPGYDTAGERFELDYIPDSDKKLNAARQDVQNMIETSYLVHEACDVIDDKLMNPMPSSVTETESSVDMLPSDALDTLTSPMGEWSSEESLKDAALQQMTKPSDNLRVDKDSPRRPTYSPGLAIRSYALEELAEKKTNKSPENIENAAKSLRFDSDSSQVDIDSGSSVDDMCPPVLYASDVSQTHLQPDTASTARVNFAQPGIFLPDQVSISRTSPFGLESRDITPMTEDERRECEDKLESLVDITAGYRFHDVGMMMGMDEGICNPAFDATDDLPSDQADGPGKMFNAQDYSSTQMEPVKAAAVHTPDMMTSSSPLQSSTLTAPSPVTSNPCKRENKALPHSETESRSNYLQSSVEMTQVSAQPCQKSVTSTTTTSPSSVMVAPKKSLLKNPVAMATTKVTGPPVPVTRHFTVTKKFESALKSLGARQVDESFLIDVYYDTSSFDLTLADAWLRTHNGKWQFHANFTTMFDSGEKRRYSEKEEARDVLAEVESVLKSSVSPEAVHRSVVSFVQKSGLREFARYTTTTRRYQLGDMSVELVMPEYGFWTGSVTSSAPCKDQTHMALKGIDDLWKKTGVSCLSLVSSP